MIPQRVAILIDGGFFLKRYKVTYNDGKSHDPKQVVQNLYGICDRHLSSSRNHRIVKDHLYRIYYYDCGPLEKRVHNPISNKVINFGNNEVAKFQNELLDHLRKSRKVALRLGYLKDSGSWYIHPRKTKDLLLGKMTIDDLSENDLRYQVQQKSVDIKIGLDIATLAYKKLVDKIVLVSGDGDFVPAAKLARREGIDFVLDPMWNAINPELFEHIDGLKSVSPKPPYMRAKGAK